MHRSSFMDSNKPTEDMQRRAILSGAVALGALGIITGQAWAQPAQQTFVPPGMAPGPGTPDPGGMTSRELLDAVRRICLELPVVGIDVVEVSPPFDSADITAILANRVVLEALSAIAKRKSGTPYLPTQNLLDR